MNSITDLLNRAYILSDEPEYVFRGEAKEYDEPCTPKLFRGHTPDERFINQFSGYKNEEKNVNDWLTEVKLAEGHQPEISTSFDRLVLAQHYGLITRLLDWTTNPLVALWFACIDHWSDDGLIYISQPPLVSLSDQGISNQHDPQGDDRYMALQLNPFCLPRIQYTTARPFSQIHYYKPIWQPDNRVLAQGSVFSTHPHTNPRVTPYDTITISSKQKRRLLRDLKVLGVDYRTLGFATRDYLAHHINGGTLNP